MVGPSQSIRNVRKRVGIEQVGISVTYGIEKCPYIYFNSAFLVNIFIIAIPLRALPPYLLSRQIHSKSKPRISSRPISNPKL